MFELKTNEEIGAYLKKLILSKYPSCRQFCIAYINLTSKYTDDPRDLRSDDIRKLTNRLSQILNGKKSIQTYDLPIFSELLGVSCEQMLSAGAVCTPITNRRTNYNIAFSTDERDWIEYINREDCIASYADEFGKTVVDYAIEFKNYGFIKFLIENSYITLVSGNKNWAGHNFGADTSLKHRPYQANTLENELYQNIVLRTQIISLALENGDNAILEEMRAREFPPQLEVLLTSTNISFGDYYDEDYIEAILHCNVDVIKYFCEEYWVKSLWQNREFLWIFPFIDKLITKAIEQKSQNTTMLLDAAIKHNENTYATLKKNILAAAKIAKDSFGYNRSYKDILISVLDELKVFQNKDVICFFPYNLRGEIEAVLTNIVHVEAKSKDPEIQALIDRLNQLYSKIINIQDHLIKQ